MSTTAPSALGRENFFWHKLHSLTGIVPIGFYMVQHLTLNSFSLAGPDKFNGVISFFDSMPKHFLLGLEILAIWAPLLFHAVYGMFIVSRGQFHLTAAASRYRENGYYNWQRYTGIIAFLYLCYHISTTTAMKYLKGTPVVEYNAMHNALTSYGYSILAIYLIGIAACCYHLSYGIWNFCIRWGITISERSQLATAKFARVAFVALTLLGWAAIVGFLWSPFAPKSTYTEIETRNEAPTAHSASAVR